jgi:hypothetical protein
MILAHFFNYVPCPVVLSGSSIDIDRYMTFLVRAIKNIQVLFVLDVVVNLL